MYTTPLVVAFSCNIPSDVRVDYGLKATLLHIHFTTGEAKFTSSLPPRRCILLYCSSTTITSYPY